MSKDASGSAPRARTSSNDAEQCSTPAGIRNCRTHQDRFSLAPEDAPSRFVRWLDVLREGVAQQLEQWLNGLFCELVQRETSRSRARAARAATVRRRRSGRRLTSRSLSLASSGARRLAARSCEATLDPRRLMVRVDDDYPPPSTERSDPPTLPSAPDLALPTQAAARPPAVEVVECGANATRPDAVVRGDAVAPRSATRRSIAIADAIEALSGQGHSIVREENEEP